MPPTNQPSSRKSGKQGQLPSKTSSSLKPPKLSLKRYEPDFDRVVENLFGRKVAVDPFSGVSDLSPFARS